MVRQRGFTLIEMMVVVAIIGILAAIATPAFLRYNYRARSAELPANLNAIKSVVAAYYAVNGSYPPTAPSPIVGNCTSGLPASPVACAFNIFDADGSDQDFTGFSGLGWIPVGQLYGQYAVTAGCFSNVGFHCFTAEAQADIDGDGIAQVWAFAHPEEVTGAFAGGTFFGGADPPLDEAGQPEVGVVARDFTAGLY